MNGGGDTVVATTDDLAELEAAVLNRFAVLEDRQRRQEQRLEDLEDVAWALTAAADRVVATWDDGGDATDAREGGPVAEACHTIAVAIGLVQRAFALLEPAQDDQVLTARSVRRSLYRAEWQLREAQQRLPEY